MHTTRVIFLALPLLFVPLVHGLSSTPDACAKNKIIENSYSCGTNPTGKKSPNGLELIQCCWAEEVPPGTGDPDFGGNVELYCQECENGGTRGPINCGDPELQFMTTPPTTGEGVLSGQGGVLEEPDQPLFGGGANVPPSGGIEQPPATTTTPPRLPGGGANVPPQGGGIAEQPPTGPTIAPEDNQDESGGGGRPPLKSDESLPFSEGGGGGEAEQPSDDGQNPTIIE